LRDPLAVNPFDLLSTYDVDTSEVAFLLKPYISLENNILLKRAYSILKPPSTVELSINNQVLYASGYAKKPWVNWAFNNYGKIIGINSFDSSNLNLVDSKIVKSVKKHVDSKKFFIESYYFVFEFTSVRLRFD